VSSLRSDVSKRSIEFRLLSTLISDTINCRTNIVVVDDGTAATATVVTVILAVIASTATVTIISATTSVTIDTTIATVASICVVVGL